MATSRNKIKSREIKNLPKMSVELCKTMLEDLGKSRKPVLQALKCSLDNAFYNPKLGYLTPGDKMVSTELNVSSILKMTRSVFFLEILLNSLETGAIRSTRELYYVAKGMCKHDKLLRPLDFSDQTESDAIIYFVCEIMECYREEFNCIANDRGGQTYCKNLVVTESLTDGTKATIDLGSLGTTPFQPQNRPQSFQLKPKKGKLDYCLIVESQATANTLVANGFTKRNNAVIMGAQGVPSNAVRSWARTVADQLDIPLYFFGDLDAYTMQNIYRTLKAGSAASLLRNSNFSAPSLRFLGVLPKDIKEYDLSDYAVNEKNPGEGRSLKKARDALANDPFFKDKNNKGAKQILEWLIKNKRRCEQQAYIMVEPKNPLILEEIIVEKIKKNDWIT